MFRQYLEDKFSKVPNTSVGLDIGSFSAKIVELKREKDSYSLKGLGFSQIKGTAQKDISDAIKKACEEARVSTKKINASIFPEGTIIRYLSLPSMSHEELDKAMDFEIERYIPFDKNEVCSDYQILREGEDKKNMQILLVATKKKVVEERVKIIEGAGLEPQVVTIDSLVLKNTFEMNYPDKKDVTVGILNLGSKISNINIVRGNISYFMRDIQLGGEDLTYLIKEKLDINNEEAEKLKYEPGDKEGEVFKTIEPVLGNLLNEIYLSFDYYESEFSMAVDEVYITGGSSSLKWLPGFLHDNLGRKVHILEAAKRIPLSKNILPDRAKSLSCCLAVAIGLALETFN